jgi:hypothetical protein
MHQPTLSGIVKRRFVHCINRHHQTAREVVHMIGIPPGELCQIIVGQQTAHLPLKTFYRIGRWLQMPLANVVALSGIKPQLNELVKLGMETRGYSSTSSLDQIQAAAEAGISVAVFRRALHGYADFRPSIRTCDQFARWLAWTEFAPDDIVAAAGMTVRYLPDGQRVTVSLDVHDKLESYPCACGRVGCLVPAHIPSGPRRKWRSDACRMWAKRQAEQAARLHTQKFQTAHTRLPRPSPIVRFIVINERLVPVRF